MPVSRWWPFALSALVIGLDQASKLLAEHLLEFRQAVSVMPYLEWYLSYNTGAAFSFLAQAGGWQRWFFIILSTAVALWLITWLWRMPRKDQHTRWALALILGGALGNLIDRILYGHVIDFIQVWLGSYPWPTFNIADSAISIGAVWLVLLGIFVRPEHADSAQ